MGHRRMVARPVVNLCEHFNQLVLVQSASENGSGGLTVYLWLQNARLA